MQDTSDIVDCDLTEHPEHAHTPASELVIDRSAAMLSAMGDESRLRLLETLLTGRHCVSELAAESGAGLSTISQRLLKLRQAGLVRRTREGRHVYYELADSVAVLVQQVLAFAAGTAP